MDYSEEQIEAMKKENQEIKKEKEFMLNLRQKVTESLKLSRHVQVAEKKKKIKQAIKVASATILLSFILVKYEKEAYINNIYENNELSISDEEAEKLYQKISKETGENVVENERVLVLNAIIENPNLTTEEKEQLYKFYDLLVENPYLNKEEAYTSLKQVKVSQKKEQAPKVKGGNKQKDYFVEGSYNVKSHKVKMYIPKTDSEYLETLYHEFIHCIYYNNETNMLPRYFMEGMTELLTNEYFTDTHYYEESSYTIEIIAVRQLCNMVGTDKVLEAFSTGNMEIIKQELSRVMSEEDSKQFLKDIEVSFYNYEKKDTIIEEDYYINMRNYLLNFDKKRYAESLENGTYEELWKEKLEESSYNIEIIKLIGKKAPYTEYKNYIAENGVYMRPLFSKKLLNSADETHISKVYIKILEH